MSFSQTKFSEENWLYYQCPINEVKRGQMQYLRKLNLFPLMLMLLLLIPSLTSANTLDPLLSKTYAARHNDCMTDKYLDDELIEAMFLSSNLLKVMDLLRNRNIHGFVEMYIDPDLLEKERKKLRKSYEQWDSLLDLKGRGLRLEDIYNAYTAAALMLYRYMHYGAGSYGLIPEKSWKAINPNAWQLTFKYDRRTEDFYFRRIGNRWYLTDKKFIKD